MTEKRKFICVTEPRVAAPQDGLEALLDATGGVISLWERNTRLSWRFDGSLTKFSNPDKIKGIVRGLLAEGIGLWQDAAPVQFAEDENRFDFEVALPLDAHPDGDNVLAEAFFPGAGARKMILYPSMFRQVKSEQIETLAHEFGHIFGLRHFFAQENEAKFPSVVFGTHVHFTIMNYDNNSYMTQADRDDLKILYESARAKTITAVGGIPIELVRP